MTNIDGHWELVLQTPPPVGEQSLTIDVKDDDGVLTGTALYNGDEYTVNDGKVEGNDISFTTTLTSPFPMVVAFTFTLDGDDLRGEAKVGPFAPATATGT